MGLIPRIESVQEFCSDSDVDSFHRFRCTGAAAELHPQESLPGVCEGLIKSMSARIHGGAVGEWLPSSPTVLLLLLLLILSLSSACRCNAVGSLTLSCSQLGGVCDCKPNVIGRCCDTCAPMTFGLGPSGCAGSPSSR